jgi:hypothetical protein
MCVGYLECWADQLGGDTRPVVAADEAGASRWGLAAETQCYPDAMSHAAFTVLTASLILGTCDPRPDCRTDTVAEYAAPGGAASAVVSHKVCTNYPSNLQVELTTAGATVRRDKHILLILDSPKANGVLRRPQVTVQWDNPQQAVVRYDTSVRMVHWGGSKVGGISVRYAPLE